MKILKQLKRSPLFSNFSDDEVNAVFDIVKARIVKYARGAIVMQVGAKSDEVGVVLQGNLIKYITKKSGARLSEGTLSEGGIFCDHEAYAGVPMRYSVATVNDVQVLFIKKDSIVDLTGTGDAAHKKLINNLVGYMASEVLRMKADTSYLIIKSMRLKLAKLILEKYEIMQANAQDGDKTATPMEVDLGMDRNGMAEYLNVSRPSMSREMIRMRDEGIIDFWKGKIKIISLEKLQEIVAKQL